jgi:hypothetical protein
MILELLPDSDDYSKIMSGLPPGGQAIEAPVVSNNAGSGLVRDPQFKRPRVQPVCYLIYPVLAGHNAGRRIVSYREATRSQPIVAISRAPPILG